MHFQFNRKPFQRWDLSVLGLRDPPACACFPTAGLKGNTQIQHGTLNLYPFGEPKEQARNARIQTPNLG